MYLALRLGGLRFISAYLFATMFVGMLALAVAYPIHPVTALGWALWFVFVLPITVSLEWIGGKVLGDRVGRRIDASRGISAKGILVALALLVAMLALGTLIVVSLGAAGGGFWETHFSDTW
ncbi:MAG: hypothetical protein WBM46_19335 [Polyangiales bacterium]